MTEAERIAREGMELHECNAPEYIVCAAVIRQAAEIERLRIPMNRWVIQSIKQEAETAIVIGDEIGMRDGLAQILKECDAFLNEIKHD